MALGAAISGCGGGSGATSLPTSGALDTSFGQGGTVTTILGNAGAQAYAVALQPDGKIVAAGSAGSVLDENALAIARYNADGTLDSAFGTAGSLVIAGIAGANAVTVQLDGKIVAVGGVGLSGGYRRPACTLTRFSASGALDTTFGSGGIVTTTLASANPSNSYTQCGAVALHPDGKIVVAAGDSGSSPKLGIIQFNADGTRDTSFGNGGEAVVATGVVGEEYARAVFVQPDGRIVVGAEDFLDTGRFLGCCEAIVARFDANGMLDLSFGQSGTFSTRSLGPYVLRSSFALQPDGKIVVASQGQVIRLLPNGTIDPAFGIGGAVSGLWSNQIALQANGGIVGVGFPGSMFYLWRLGADGSVDAAFGDGGLVSTPIAGGASPFAVAIQSNGFIVAAGTATVPNSAGASPASINAFALARYIGE